MKIGDKVVCINKKTISRIELGKVYTVTCNPIAWGLDPKRTIRVEGFDYGIYESRFVLAGKDTFDSLDLMEVRRCGKNITSMTYFKGKAVYDNWIIEKCPTDEAIKIKCLERLEAKNEQA